MGGIMKIIKMSEVPKEPYLNPLFTGSDVTQQLLVSDSKDLTLSIVNFGKGIKNKFHIHDSDQVLIPISGKGIVATEDEERLVTVGELIFFPAGRRHWHGAAEDSEFSHIVVLRAGSKYAQADRK